MAKAAKRDVLEMQPQAGHLITPKQRTLSNVLIFVMSASVWIWLLIFGAFFAILSPEYFLTVQNIFNIVRQAGLYGIISIGMTFVIISGGIDLSVGSIISLTGSVFGMMWQATHSIALATTAGMMTGIVAGGISGTLVAYGRLPPFIATFGMLSIGRGLAFLVTPYSIGGFPEWFEYLGNGQVSVVPTVVIIFVVLIALSHLILRKTKYGYDILAIGGNEGSARFAGINIPMRKMSVYIISAGLASFISIVLCSKLRSEYPGIGQGYELQVIAATLIGGTDLMGGYGSMINTAAGAILVGLINNGLTLRGIYPFMQQIIMGAFIIIAVLANTLFYQKRDYLGIERRHMDMKAKS